jgi:hypothetical protein
MSAIQGQRIAAAIKEHSSLLENSPVKIAYDMLTRGDLRTKHFDAVSEFLRKTLEATPLKTMQRFEDSAHLPLASRRVEMYLAYIAVSKNDPNVYIPALARVLLGQESLMVFSRPMPIHINSGHVEFRRLQRSADLLTYDEPDFAFSCAFALALSKVLESRFTPEMKELPVVIPQTNGMYLGTAVQVPLDAYLHHEYLMRQRPNLILPETSKLQADWYASVQVNIKTYVSHTELRPLQRRLWLALLEQFHKSEAIRSGLERNVDFYLLGSEKLIGKDLPKITAAHDKLLNVVQSPLWQQEVRAASEK